MESSLWIFLALATLPIIHIVRSQNQQGFISLDCGLPETEVSPYKEEFTGLQFYTDATVIQSGKLGRVQANVKTNILKPYKTLRYFPVGIRNCYNLKVEKGRNHLIRARFVYGNYDGLDNSPKFDMYLGPNLWATIDLHGVENGTREEIFHIPTSNSLQICLVKTGSTSPMISALEIRPLGDNSYITEYGSLKLYFRRYLNESKNILRYPDDVYDRQWTPYFLKEWSQISTTSNVVNNNNYEPPKKALATGVTPTNASEPLTIEWTNSDNPTAQYYLYRHFAEIQELGANDTREFDMLWNGEVMPIEHVIPRKLKIYTIFSKSPKTCQGGKCSFQLIRTKRSTFPPILNALELYTVIQFPQPETDESDVEAIKNIATTYKLSNINWQGDPCVPVRFRWDVIKCSKTFMISTPPKITSLNLSSNGLTGNIAAAIQNLTLLEKLDLSNNNLTGEVPEFLGSMKSLTFINLKGNNLNGLIPQALQNKGVQLFVEGNPRLCFSAYSCRKPPKKIFKKFHWLIVVVAVIVIVIVVALVVFLVRRRRMKNDNNCGAVTSTKTFSKKKKYTFSEVNGFLSEEILGEGGYGKVYLGSLNSAEMVAIKIINQSTQDANKQFEAEVNTLIDVNHKNLVRLVGYCNEQDKDNIGQRHLVLIYEYVANGDLKQHLNGTIGEGINNWKTRLQIALDAAEGLDYLHIKARPKIVHRDVKSANILLDGNMNAKLGDFGLSRFLNNRDESQVSSSNVGGTHGYIDPEYVDTNQCNEKSDVYSFGIVLLEIITNHPVINGDDTKTHIREWVLSQLGPPSELQRSNNGLALSASNQETQCAEASSSNGLTISEDSNGETLVRNCVDHKIQSYNHNSALRALNLGILCSERSPSNRPVISYVVNELRECIGLEDAGARNTNG